MIYQISEGVTGITPRKYSKQEFTKALNRLKYSVSYLEQTDGSFSVYVEPYEKKYKATNETVCEEKLLQYVKVEKDFVYVSTAVLLCHYVQKKDGVATSKVATYYPNKIQELFEVMDAVRKIRVETDVKRRKKNLRNL